MPALWSQGVMPSSLPPFRLVCQLHAAARLPQTCRSLGHSVPCQCLPCGHRESCQAACPVVPGCYAPQLRLPTACPVVTGCPVPRASHRRGDTQRASHRRGECQMHAPWSQGTMPPTTGHPARGPPSQLHAADRCMLPCGGTKIMAQLGRGGPKPRSLRPRPRSPQHCGLWLPNRRRRRT